MEGSATVPAGNVTAPVALIVPVTARPVAETVARVAVLAPISKLFVAWLYERYPSVADVAGLT